MKVKDFINKMHDYSTFTGIRFFAKPKSKTATEFCIDCIDTDNGGLREDGLLTLDGWGTIGEYMERTLVDFSFSENGYLDITVKTKDTY